MVCFVGLCLWTSVISLKICAFNIQSYGEAKASNKKVMEILMKVYRLYENMTKSEMSLLISTPALRTQWHILTKIQRIFENMSKY